MKADERTKEIDSKWAKEKKENDVKWEKRLAEALKENDEKWEKRLAEMLSTIREATKKRDLQYLELAYDESQLLAKKLKFFGTPTFPLFRVNKDSTALP